MLTNKEALQAAKTELNRATYLSECGRNAGIRKIYGDKADWLSNVIYYAEKGTRKEDEKNGVHIQ